LNWLRIWLPEDQQHYEALYFACQQVHDEVTGEYDNPILRPFIELCIEQLPTCWGRDSPAGPGPTLTPVSKVNFLTREATNYIAGVVEAALRAGDRAPTKLGQLHGPLLDACADPSVRSVDVITLNHDTLLERSFIQAGVPVEDGFRPSRIFPGLNQWTGYRASERPRVRLVKLHGSVDWWEVARQNGSRRPLLVQADLPPERLRDRRGRIWDRVRRANILVGTSNKLLDYLRPGNLVRLAVFRKALMNSDALVVGGYSFRDKGVNSLLVHWARGARRMVVVSPGLEGHAPPSTARRAVAKEWPRWIGTGILAPVASSFSAASWASLRKRLALP
jgi:hypothetical protein